MKYLSLFLIVFTCLYSKVYSQVVSIPLDYTNQPAKDLVSEDGKKLSKFELNKIFKDVGDLSQLNPEENDLWKNSIGKKLSSSDDDLNIKGDEVFQYIDKVVSNIGSFRFVIRESSDSKRNFNVWMSKDNRSILLRKNLLRKLGYKVSKIEHKNRLKLRFNGKVSLDAFIESLENSTYADSKRWVIKKEESEFLLTLQDVLVIETDPELYNIALGEVTEEAVKHRRVMNVLSVVFGLVDVRESVDGFKWSMGRIDNKVLLIDSFNAESYTTTYYDLIWILKRLSKLSKSDIEEIVNLSYFPDSVSLLLVEKIASRFNSIARKILKLKNKFKVNFLISDPNSSELVKGRLTQDEWPGHAARYSYDDTLSPLSKREMTSYFKSKVYSAAIDNVVDQVNDKLLYSTDIQEEAIKRALQAQKDQFIELLRTGEFKSIPFSAWVIPTVKGHIGASRNIITGSYLGTDNSIQIADSLEFIGEVGAFVGTLGLPTKYQVYGGGSVRYSRSYTHVKAIRSITKALEEPYRNILVPKLKREKAMTIIDMIDQIKTEKFAALKGEERTEELSKIFKHFDEVMNIGDSLIISNNLILAGNVSGGVKIPAGPLDIEAMVQLNARKLNLWRLHILRSDEKNFQIYRSRADSVGRGIGFQAKALIPIISINWDKHAGVIRTNFNSLEMSKVEDDSSIIRKLTQLRQVLVENSTELLNVDQKPFKIKHEFSEKSVNRRFLVKQKNTVNLQDKMTLTHSTDYTAELFVSSVAQISGKNYMQVAYDSLNALISELFDTEEINFYNAESGNPGDSFKGESFSRQVMTEVPFKHLDKDIPFEKYAQITSQWKGWKADRAKLTEINNQIQKKYGKAIFEKEQFFDTDEVQLYKVDIILSLYQIGLDYLINIPAGDLEKVLVEELVLPWKEGRSHYKFRGKRRVNYYEEKRDKLISSIMEVHSRLNSEYVDLMTPQQKSQDITFLVDALENTLPLASFEKVVGGDEHFYLKATVSGFRGGIENGEEPIVSDAIGEYGSELPAGVLATVRQAIKISQGELGAYWFLRRVQ